MDDAFLPFDIIADALPQHLTFRTKIALGYTCKRLQSIWKSWVRKLPAIIMFKCNTIEKLRSFDGLREISDRCDRLQLMTKFPLKHPQLESLIVKNFPDYVDTLRSFKNFKTLTITGNKFKGSIITLTNLTSLNINSIDEGLLNDFDINGLTNLKALTVRDSHGLTAAAISGMTNLEELNIGNNCYVEQMDVAMLGYNKSVHIENGISKLINLTSLSCDGNMLIDADISGLTKLTKLITRTNMKNITSAAFTNLTKLRKLIFTKGHDSWISHLTNLQTLIMGKSIDITDNSISLLTNLQSLNMKECLVNNYSLELLTNLTDLHIDHSNDKLHMIRITGSALRHLTKIDCLYLHSSLKGINDDDIACLTNLQTLVPSDMLTNKSIENLTSLTNLTLNNNMSDAGLIGLVNLTRIIDFYGNITDASITNLVNLESLTLARNSTVSASAIVELKKLTHFSTRSINLRFASEIINKRIPFDPTY